MMKNNKTNYELFEFIKNSPTCYHAVETAKNMLNKNGFTELFEKEKWQLQGGGKYYVVCANSSIAAFVMPQKSYTGYHIIASHGDSPCFKLKANPHVKSGKYTTLNIESYGGMPRALWFDRPLSVAGRVVLNKGGKICSELVNIDKDFVSIVNVAIHLDREVNKGTEYKIQSKMLPIFACGGNNTTVNDVLANNLGIKSSDIIDSDLFLYCRTNGTVWGANEEFISAPRLDDLQCCFASIKALLSSKHDNKICMAVIFDNEEVGSATKQGAQSTFLKHTLKRIAAVHGKGQEEELILLANSSMISADNGHAVHPNFADREDVTNKPYVGGGILIKYSANQKYTTDAFTGGAVRIICDKAEVPYQIYHNNSDLPGGSTLGNISQSQVSVPCADIGVAMLSMHSPYETTGAGDTKMLADFMKAYYETDVI